MAPAQSGYANKLPTRRPQPPAQSPLRQLLASLRYASTLHPMQMATQSRLLALAHSAARPSRDPPAPLARPASRSFAMYLLPQERRRSAHFDLLGSCCTPFVLE